MYMIKVVFHQSNNIQKFIFSANTNTKVYEFIDLLNEYFEVPVYLEFENFQLHPDSYIGIFNEKEIHAFPLESSIIIESDELIVDLDSETQIDPAALEPFNSVNMRFIRIQPGEVIKFRLDLDGYYKALECGYDIQEDVVYEVTFVDQARRRIEMDNGNLVIGYDNMILL